MATPITFKEQTDVLSIGDVDVPFHLDDGLYTTFWKLSDDELADVLQTGVVLVHTTRIHPIPVAVASRTVSKPSEPE